MSFVYGTNPDSHLLGGWQFDPNKLNTAIDREVSATDQRLLQPTTCGTAATITLSCEHFLLDVSLNAAASLAGAVGELSIGFCRLGGRTRWGR